MGKIHLSTQLVPANQARYDKLCQSIEYLHHPRSKISWQSLSTAQKVFRVITLGLYSPKYSPVLISDARKLINQFVPINQAEPVTCWVTKYADQSVIMLQKTNNNIKAVIWNPATAESTEHVIEERTFPRDVSDHLVKILSELPPRADDKPQTIIRLDTSSQTPSFSSVLMKSNPDTYTWEPEMLNTLPAPLQTEIIQGLEEFSYLEGEENDLNDSSLNEGIDDKEEGWVEVLRKKTDINGAGDENSGSDENPDVNKTPTMLNTMDNITPPENRNTTPPPSIIRTPVILNADGNPMSTMTLHSTNLDPVFDYLRLDEYIRGLALPCTLLKKSTPKQKVAGELARSLGKLAESAVQDLLSKMEFADTVDCRYQSRNSHPIAQVWQDIGRARQIPLFIAGTEVVDRAREILFDAIEDNTNHVPTQEQYDEICTLMGGEDGLSDAFKTAIRSKVAMTILGAIQSQCLTSDCNEALYEKMGEKYREDNHRCLDFRQEGNRSVSINPGSTPGHYDATTSRSRVIFSFNNGDAWQNNSGLGVQVTRVKITADENTRLPINPQKGTTEDERTLLSEDDYMDIPVTYSGSIYWVTDHQHDTELSLTEDHKLRV